jgi:RES domain-containing protein
MMRTGKFVFVPSVVSNHDWNVVFDPAVVESAVRTLVFRTLPEADRVTLYFAVTASPTNPPDCRCHSRA